MVKLYQKFLIGFALVVGFVALNLALGRLSLIPSEVLSAIEAVSVAVVGIYFTIVISDGIRDFLAQRTPSSAVAIVLPNVIKYLGYVLVFVGVLLSFGVNATTALAGGAFAGLIVGLALQPILENFFAGILIIATGFVTVGDHIRLMSTQIPYSPAVLPPYKFLSRDYLELGIDGTVVEIDLFFSRILMENGREVRVPNSLIVKSSVVDYTSKFSNRLYVTVRAEFPIDKVDLNSLEDEIMEALKDFQVVEGPYLHEQSDKDFVIVSLKVEANVDDWKRVKSEALKRLLLLRKAMIERAQTLQQTK